MTRVDNGPAKSGRKDDKALDRQLQKTKICQYFMNGVCKHGAKCRFAHGNEELHQQPDLSKTRICPKGTACTDPNCQFAHSEEELRSTDFCYKTSLCIWYSSGKCRNGSRCRFAHGHSELNRGSEGGNKLDGKKNQERKKTQKRAAQTKSSLHENQDYPVCPVAPKKEASEPMFIQPPSGMHFQDAVNHQVGLSQLLGLDAALQQTGMQLGLPPQQIASRTPSGYPSINNDTATDPAFGNREIAMLSANIKSLSEQLQKLQECITTSSGQSTQSPESSTLVSTGSSPPSTPPRDGSDQESPGLRAASYHAEVARLRQELEQAAFLTNGHLLCMQPAPQPLWPLHAGATS